MGLRSWVKRKSRKAKRDFAKAGREIDRTGKRAVNDVERDTKRAAKDFDRLASQSIDEIERAAKQAGHAMEGEIMGVIDDVKDLANTVKGEIEGVANKAKGEIEGVANKAKGEIVDTANAAKQGVYSAGDEVKDAFAKELPALAEKAFDETRDAFEKQLPELLQKCLSDLVSEGIKPALKAQAKIARDFADGMDHVVERSPDLVDAINTLGFEVELKVNVEMTLEYANFWTRAREVAGILDRYGNDGIALRRRDILGFIVAVGPDSVSFGGGASFSLGLDIGGVAKAKSIPLALFLELADYVMQEAGVPE